MTDTEAGTPLTAEEERRVREDHDGTGTCYAIEPHPCLHARLLATLDAARRAGLARFEHGHFGQIVADSDAVERAALALHERKGGGPFGVEGECECREDAEAALTAAARPATDPAGLPDHGFAADRPTGPRTMEGHALARNLRDRDPEVDWDAWIRSIEEAAARLSVADGRGPEERLRDDLLAWVRKQRATPWSEGSFASSMTGEQGYDAALEELEYRLR